MDLKKGLQRENHMMDLIYDGVIFIVAVLLIKSSNLRDTISNLWNQKTKGKRLINHGKSGAS